MPFELSGLLLAVPASIEDMEPGQRLMLMALAAFSTIWVTALGAAIGSFLNVVIYRLPRGKSLLRPKSQCPVCGTPIRPGDNVPVLGWLRLRGRCRSCGGPISPRYPLVEAATAVLFLGLAHFELFSGGANLPGGPEGVSRLGFVLWRIEPALIGLFAYHAVLLTVLLCVSLIVWDGFPPPRRLLNVGLLFGLLFPVLLPEVHPVASGLPVDRMPSWSLPLGTFTLGVNAGALADALLGLAVGGAVGLLLAGAAPKSPSAAADRRGTIATAALVGTFLGWQAAISCGLLAAVLAVVNALASHMLSRPLPVSALVAVTTLVQIPLWRDLAASRWLPGPSGWPIVQVIGWPDRGFSITSLVAAAFVTGMIALFAGSITRRPGKADPPAQREEEAASSPVAADPAITAEDDVAGG